MDVLHGGGGPGGVTGVKEETELIGLMGVTGATGATGEKDEKKEKKVLQAGGRASKVVQEVLADLKMLKTFIALPGPILY